MREKILHLRSQGLSYNEIVKELDCAKSTVAYHCGDGVKDKHIARQRDRRNSFRKFIAQYKQERGCMDCGEDYPYYMLDFDHLRDKRFSIGGQLASFSSLEDLKEEIKKCEVVCSNCHRIRTYQRILKTGGDTMELSDFYE